MSAEAVDALKAIFGEFARGSFEPIDDLGDDVELVTAPEMPDAGTYRGQAAKRWLKTWVESFDSLAFEPAEFLDAGEHVVVESVQRGIPRGGTASVELPTWAVHTFANGVSITRIQLFMTRREALEAAGVPE